MRTLNKFRKEKKILTQLGYFRECPGPGPVVSKQGRVVEGQGVVFLLYKTLKWCSQHLLLCFKHSRHPESQNLRAPWKVETG